MKRFLLQGLLAFLLLAGQHSALVHSVWHLHDRLPAQARHDGAAGAQDNGDEQPSQSRLCDLHATLGALLSGDCAGVTTFTAAAAPFSFASGDFAWRTAHRATTPPSRAPPVLL